MRDQKNNHDSNHSLRVVTYLLLAVFVCMIVYFFYFMQVQAMDVINNPYNSRLNLFAERTIRGDILSSDGQILATTEVEADGTEKRVYPYGSLFAHSVGYSSPGKTGVENLANFYLLTSHENTARQIINELSEKKNMGDSVVTTLDVSLQKAASDALNGRNGAVVAIDPRSGKILAMVSNPGFDPNTLEENWDRLISSDNTEGQLLNRASQGLYPPGSVFKIVTLLEYIKENPNTWRDYSYDCNGTFEYDGYTISCYHQTAHGHQTIGEAFANSCNGAFASIGLTLDKSSFQALADSLLFNHSLPLTIEYSKSSFKMGADAGTWEVLQTSIGQGSTQVTPIHIAMITSAIARGGTLMKPYLVDSVTSPSGSLVRRFSSDTYGNLLSRDEAELLGTAMRMVVTEGTATSLQNDVYTAAGKTGSAEFEDGKDTHAWFTGYAPCDDPEIVVTVIVEEGGSGGSVAAPVAKAVFDTYFTD